MIPYTLVDFVESHIKAEKTDAEILSLLNEPHEEWRDVPVKDVLLALQTTGAVERFKIASARTDLKLTELEAVTAISVMLDKSTVVPMTMLEVREKVSKDLATIATMTYVDEAKSPLLSAEVAAKLQKLWFEKWTFAQRILNREATADDVADARARIERRKWWERAFHAGMAEVNQAEKVPTAGELLVVAAEVQ